MMSVYTGEIRKNNRRDLVINYCKTLDSDFSILLKTHVNFTHLHDTREFWDGKVILLPGKAQTCGVLVLAKRTTSPIVQIITDPAVRYIFFKIKNTTDAVLALYAPSGAMKERRTDRQMFIGKIEKLLYNKIARKNSLILLGEVNMTLGNKDRSTRSKGFCESQEELMNLITEFDLEDLWRRQNLNGPLYTHFHGRSNTYSRIDRTYTSTNLRVDVKTDHEINTFSSHFQTIVINREPTNFKRGKGYWILNCGLLQDKEYIQHIKILWENWQTQQNDLRSISEWWEEGKQHIKVFTKLYTRADTIAQQQKKCSLKRRLRNIYTKIDAKLHLQNSADKLKNELKQIEMKKAEGTKIREKIP